MAILAGDTLYFDADDGQTGNVELWAHDTSNASTWQVADIYSGSTGSYPGSYMGILVGDTLYFSAQATSSNHELWAHDTSNSSTWQVADINSGYSSVPGEYMEILVGDTLYFDAVGSSSGRELWAHDTSNASTWQVTDINSGTGGSDPGSYMAILVGDTLYFNAKEANSGFELWAHDTSNASTWQVADIRSGSTGSNPGQLSEILVGDTLYFYAKDNTPSALWAHDTSNSSTWKAVHTNPAGNSNPSGLILVGDTLYFGASDISAHKFWAHQPGEITSLSSGSGNGASSSSAFAYANNKLDANRATHTCAITENGDLKCWGWDNKGQLGDGGSNTDTNAPSSTAIDLGTGRTALQVVTGLQHTCAILDNGDMKCWGYDWKGQLGDGGTAANTANPTANDLNAPSSTPINLGSGRTAVAASAGDPTPAQFSTTAT